MGNALSGRRSGLLEERQSFSLALDTLVEQLISTESFKTFELATDKTNCDRLVVLVGNMIERELNGRRLSFISGESVPDTRDTVFFQRDRIGTDGRSGCEAVASFYVAVAKFVGALSALFPSGSRPGKALAGQLMPSSGLCSSLLDAVAVPSPDMCQFSDTKLGDYAGISELEALYMDVYNPDTGEFDQMSKTNRAQYDDMVASAYRRLTGLARVPANLKLGDIPVSGSSSACNITSQIPLDGMVPYASNLSDMRDRESNFVASVRSLTRRLFRVRTVDGEKRPVIAKDISMSELERISDELAVTIANRMVECSESYAKAISLLQEAIDSRITTLAERKASGVASFIAKEQTRNITSDGVGDRISDRDSVLDSDADVSRVTSTPSPGAQDVLERPSITRKSRIRWGTGDLAGIPFVYDLDDEDPSTPVSYKPDSPISQVLTTA